MKRILIFIMVFALAFCAFIGCNGTQNVNDDHMDEITGSGDDDATSPDDDDNEEFVNPGDFLGGGGTGDVADEADDSVADKVKDDISGKDFDDISGDTSEDGTIEYADTDEIIEITQSGSYLFKGSIGGIKICDNGLNLHFIFDGVTITNEAIAVDGSKYKKAELIITIKDGTKNEITSGSGENAIHVKGSLSINGTGALKITSGKNAVKVSKDLTIVDCSLELNADNHAVSALSVSASNCKINVSYAGKDGINAECDDETTQFTLEEGFVYLNNVMYECSVMGDGIQADTAVYIDGGSYKIKTNGEFVADTTANRTEYELTADDFRFIKSGDGYQKVASDYFGRETLYALKQGCKGIKVGEIEYPDPNDDSKEITVYDGDYSIIISSGEFDINSTDDAIHANSGNLVIEGGTFNITTLDDALTSDKLTKITEGNITVASSYEGIEGGYIEISGGKIDICSNDDGINAASDDTSVVEHIIISGGTIFVDSNGDGLDSNGSILISGGEVYVAGPTSGADSAMDADRGIVVNGGYLFATGSLGMVETPASNSAQCVISFARNSAISSGTNLALTDKDGNAIFTFTNAKSCQSVIISCPELAVGETYCIYGGDTELCTFTISGTITSVGSSGGMGNPGGNPPGGGGRFPGWW